MKSFTDSERRYRETILDKDKALRAFLESCSIEANDGPHAWLEYLTGIKDALGNINNDVSFVASLLIKDYLWDRFAVRFDAGRKPQGAPGIDVEAVTDEGLVIIGELKTTKPYQPGFGAQQRATILKDLDRLQNTVADHRLMFVTDPDSFNTLCGERFKIRAPDVEIVDLVTLRSSVTFW